MDQLRLSRLFNPRTRRCFDVAIDHRFFNEKSILAGIENLSKAVETAGGIPVLWAAALASQHDQSVVPL
jgi:DhnA family fructose-bisphosphate aldolase class Ia